MHFHRVHIEITNICGLACSFCPPKLQASKTMPLVFFEKVIKQLQPLTRSLAFHVMGDPLTLSNLKEYLDLVTEHDYDIKVVQATGYLDTDTNTFRLTGYNGKTLFNARLEIDSNREVWFYPAKDGVEKISSKD